MLLAGDGDATPLPTSTPRFELAAPLTTVPGVTIDRLTTGIGLAQELAKALGLSEDRGSRV